MEDIMDADYAHTKRVCKDFHIKKLAEYHDFYAQTDTLLLADVFENFGNMCLKIYGLCKYMCLHIAKFLHLLDKHGKQR